MVKATFKGKREPMELEGDMILGYQLSLLRFLIRLNYH